MIDLLLLLMAFIWGTNYSIVKYAFEELDPQAFNAARMMIVSLVFLAVIGVLRFSAPQSSQGMGLQAAFGGAAAGRADPVRAGWHIPGGGQAVEDLGVG